MTQWPGNVRIPSKQESDRLRDVQSGQPAVDLSFMKSFDGVLWAQEFAKAAKMLYGVDLDIAWLTGWMANAMMRGYDEAMEERGIDEALQRSGADLALHVLGARRGI